MVSTCVVYKTKWILGKFTAVKMFALWIDPGSICEAVWENPSDDAVAKFGQIDKKDK